MSLEANPGTLDQAQLTGYRQAGVNRLSLGIQSLNEHHLQLLGRIHSATEARRAVDMARAAGFDNLSLDLMFALPGQTLETLQQDLEGLLALQPQHLSLYGLTFEPGTALTDRLRRGELAEIDEQGYIDSYLLLNRQLSAAGFEHYEISNFARPGYRCRHNQAYWQRRTCLALGCGGHSFLADGWGERWHVPADLPAYRQKLLSGEPASELLETFDHRTAMAETAYLALRTADGIARSGFKQRFGIFPEKAFSAAFLRHPTKLLRVDDCWRLDLQSWLLYDHLIRSFL
ncbi:MAG: coproporphyrinogen III oxidase family protein [Deltaproteobacteria bacterium]|nr:coproporphyrinogen III oxidase family protein [Deltaproteobacteria bacterium]